MSEPIYRDIKISGVDSSGRKIESPATLIVCSNCKADPPAFFAYLVGKGDHMHLQCVECGVSFCDNQCNEVDRN